MAGYYHIGWYTEGSRGAVNHDYALAASSVRFVEPTPVGELPSNLRTICSVPFRTMKPIDAATTTLLRAVCDDLPDRTADYIDEIHRVERFVKARSRYSYPSWGRVGGFEWSDAAGYYYRPGVDVPKVPNSSKTHRWRCGDCGYVISNSALLKRCPLCGEMGTLTPMEDPA